MAIETWLDNSINPYDTHMNLDRFKPPTAADEIASCQCCNARVHYTALDGNGLCWECRDQKHFDQEEPDANPNRYEHDDRGDN